MAPFQFCKMRCSGHIARSPQLDCGWFFRRALRYGPDIPSTRLAICHVIWEPLMCLATGDAAAQNLCEALHFQHSPALTGLIRPPCRRERAPTMEVDHQLELGRSRA